MECNNLNILNNFNFFLCPFGINLRRLMVFTLILIAPIAISDLVDDYFEGDAWYEIVLDIVFFLLIASPIFLVWKGVIIRLEESTKTIKSALSESERQRIKYQEALSETQLKLYKQINSWFDTWQVTPSEREVGLLLLRGLSFKEIADIRNTREQTVRLHASRVYSRAGVSSRQELAAFFMSRIMA